MGGWRGGLGWGGVGVGVDVVEVLLSVLRCHLTY